MPEPVRVTLQLPKIALMRPQDAEPIIRQEVGQTLQAEVQGLTHAIKSETPVDTGVLRSSIVGTVRHGPGRYFTGQIAAGRQAPHAIYVEEGTRPHWPPIRALEGWARRHGISAFLVARAISRRGTRAVRMFARNWDAWRPKWQPALDQAMRRVRERLTR